MDIHTFFSLSQSDVYSLVIRVLIGSVSLLGAGVLAMQRPQFMNPGLLVKNSHNSEDVYGLFDVSLSQWISAADFHLMSGLRLHFHISKAYYTL